MRSPFSFDLVQPPLRLGTTRIRLRERRASRTHAQPPTSFSGLRLASLALAAIGCLLSSPALGEEALDPPGSVEVSTSSSPIRFRGRDFVPPLEIERNLELELQRRASHPLHFLLQLKGVPTPETIRTLNEAGIRLLLPIKERGWFASAPRGTRIPRDLINYAGLLQPQDKLHPALASEPPVAPQRRIDVEIVFHLEVPVSRSRELVREVAPEARAFGPGFFEAETTLDQILNLAGKTEVMWIEPRTEHPLLLHQARQSAKVESLQNPTLLNDNTSISYDLSGNGVQVAVFDNGVDPSHDDFAGRILRTSVTGQHGTHVAGIIGGSGFLSDKNGHNGDPYQFRGMAPECEIASYAHRVDQGDYEELISTHGCDLTNNSWVQSLEMAYDARSMLLDQLVRGSAGRLISIIFGAGNNGAAVQYPPLVGYYSTFTSAKNTISAGATDSDNDLRATFSAMGPTFDGRLKPDLAAPGCTSNFSGILSAVPGDTYQGLCGTSMASPSTTGVAALLLERYAQVYGVDLEAQPMRPSTLKAVLVETARDLVQLSPPASDPVNPDTGVRVFYHQGPDYATGHGLIDAEAASSLIEEKRILELDATTTGLHRSLEIEVPPSLSELSVTLAWDDLPGNPAENNTLSKLVNDLDLVLRGPDDGEHLPWILTPPPHEPYDGSLTGIDPISPAQILPATRGVDSVNNLEKVTVPNPIPGTWTLRVEATSLSAPQTFSLASNVGLETILFSTSCDPQSSATFRLDLTARLENRLDSSRTLDANFTVREVSTGSARLFRTIEDKTVGAFADVERSVRVRLPNDLPRDSDHELRIRLFDHDTGELLALTICGFRTAP